MQVNNAKKELELCYKADEDLRSVKEQFLQYLNIYHPKLGSELRYNLDTSELTLQQRIFNPRTDIQFQPQLASYIKHGQSHEKERYQQAQEEENDFGATRVKRDQEGLLNTFGYPSASPHHVNEDHDIGISIVESRIDSNTRTRMPSASNMRKSNV